MFVLALNETYMLLITILNRVYKKKASPSKILTKNSFFQSFLIKFYVPFATTFNDISVSLQEKIMSFENFTAI